MSENLFSQDTIYGLPLNLLPAISQPNKSISNNKIKIADEYYYWDSIYHNDTSYLFSRTKYDKKGRVIEKIEYDQYYTSYQLKCSAKVDWTSDTTAIARIIYNKDYNDGELIKKYNTINGDFEAYTPCLTRIDNSNKYYSDLKIEYNKNNTVKSIIYLDNVGKICLYYINRPYSEEFKPKTEKSDTILYENKKIKRIIYQAMIDSQRTNGYLQDAYTIKNTFDFFYDSIGKVKGKISVFSQNNNHFDTMRTTYIYYDSTKYKAILGADGTNGFHIGNVFFNYDKNGKLIGLSHDKYDNGIIDDEYSYNGNETIHKYTFFVGGLKDRIQTIETYYKDNLIIQSKFYLNNKIETSREFYVYKKRNTKLKNKIIIKLPN